MNYISLGHGYTEARRPTIYIYLLSKIRSDQRQNEKEMEEKGRKRIVLVAAPFQGHMIPMLQLGTILHSRGFSITVAHSGLSPPNPSTHPQFSFLPLSEADDLPKYDNSLRNILPVIDALNVKCRAPLHEYLVHAMKKQEPDDRVICVIYDPLMYFSEAVTLHLKLPTIIMRASSALYLLSCRSLFRLQDQGCFPIQESMLQDLVPGLHPIRFKDLPISHPSIYLLEVIETLTKLRSSSAIIWNTVECLEQSSIPQAQQHYQVPLFPIGPLHKIASRSSTSLLEEDTNCITWLNNQAPKSVVFVSFGSLVMIDEKELAETAWGLANSEQPFLWVVRPGSVSGSEWVELLPKGFEDIVRQRGHIVKWAPQKEVLAHSAVGGFLSHCGWNSTMESICNGVPMICKPCFADQKVNARYLTHVWKVGIELDSMLERGEIERAIRRLMVDKGEEMTKRATELKEKVEASVQEGGSSYNSLNDLTDFILSF